jgi:hypothetical protein
MKDRGKKGKQGGGEGENRERKWGRERKEGKRERA